MRSRAISQVCTFEMRNGGFAPAAVYSVPEPGKGLILQSVLSCSLAPAVQMLVAKKAEAEQQAELDTIEFPAVAVKRRELLVKLAEKIWQLCRQRDASQMRANRVEWTDSRNFNARKAAMQGVNKMVFRSRERKDVRGTRAEDGQERPDAVFPQADGDLVEWLTNQLASPAHALHVDLKKARDIAAAIFVEVINLGNELSSIAQVQKEQCKQRLQSGKVLNDDLLGVSLVEEATRAGNLVYVKYQNGKVRSVQLWRDYFEKLVRVYKQGRHCDRLMLTHLFAMAYQYESLRRTRRGSRRRCPRRSSTCSGPSSAWHTSATRRRSIARSTRSTRRSPTPTTFSARRAPTIQSSTPKQASTR